jgi:ribonuclease HI
VGRPEPPEVPHELVEYDNEYTDGYSKYDGIPPGEKIERPQPPFGAYDLSDDSQWVSAVEDYMDFANPPFSNYKVEEDSSYAEQLGTNRWWVVPDGTIGETGIEVVSPPMPMPDFVKMVPKMFKWIGEEGYTNDKCGFHIHMSLKGVPDLKKEIDLVKLTMFTDEEYIFKSFKSRLNNEFVVSVKKRMISSKSITKAEVKDLIDVKKLEQKVASSHYNAINWEGLSDDHGHIEYRYIGGKGYHKQWDKIKTITGQYAYNLNLACNKEFKKKEYFRKMFRVINKAEMKFLSWQLDTMEYVMTQSYKLEKDNKLLRKFIMTEYKRLANQYKNLEKLYGKSLKIGELSVSDKAVYVKNLWSQIQKLKPSKEFANKYKVGLMGG